ncbi:MAG: prepilin-type N-terminal cleavage/methylation domain-containing protein [Candidatus Wallbacteria bacterium]|nr:prepilin-type N-terminal cleavage/methylation domain-containing protein [Candidatus Wallbacteria bacterium]
MNKRRGFSFIEVMVVLGIGVFFMGVVYTFWHKGMGFISRGSYFLQMQRGARFTMEKIEDDLEQCAYFKPDQPFSIKVASGEIEFWKYSDKLESEGRPKLQKVNYKLEKDPKTDSGQIVRTVTEDSAIIKREKFGDFFVKAEFEPYKLKIGSISTLMSDRYFIRVYLEAYTKGYQEKEQTLQIVTSFDLKTPNGNFRDYYYLHNPVSKRDVP